jgi:hypothetical protein
VDCGSTATRRHGEANGGHRDKTLSAPCKGGVGITTVRVVPSTPAVVFGETLLAV